MNTRITDYVVEGLRRLSQRMDRFIRRRRAKESYPISGRDCLLSARDYIHQDETKKEEPAAKKKVKAGRKTTNEKTATKKNVKKKAGVKKTTKKKVAEKKTSKKKSAAKKKVVAEKPVIKKKKTSKKKPKAKRIVKGSGS